MRLSFIRRFYPRLLAAGAVALTAVAQMRAPSASRPAALPPPTRQVMGKSISVPCVKPSAWSEILIPEIKSAADLGWTFANGKGTAPVRNAAAVQQSLNELSERSKKATGHYTDSAISQDMEHYRTGLQQLAACPSGGVGAAGLAEAPVLSIRHLSHTVNVIRQLHEEAKHPTMVPGRAIFGRSEIGAAKESAVSQTSSQVLIPDSIHVFTGSTPQAKAGSELERIMVAGVKAASNARPAPNAPVVVTTRPAAPVLSPATAQARSLLNSGLTHPAAPGVVRTIKPVQPQNVNSMNNWIEKPALIHASAARETIGALVETR